MWAYPTAVVHCALHCPVRTQKTVVYWAESVVRFVMLTFAILTVLFGRENPNLILIAFLICYGIAAFGDGLVGVPWADLLGTSLDNRWRARLFGLMTAGAGIYHVCVSPLIGFILNDKNLSFPANYATVIGFAGLVS